MDQTTPTSWQIIEMSCIHSSLLRMPFPSCEQIVKGMCGYSQLHSSQSCWRMIISLCGSWSCICLTCERPQTGPLFSCSYLFFLTFSHFHNFILTYFFFFPLIHFVASVGPCHFSIFCSFGLSGHVSCVTGNVSVSSVSVF